MTTAFTAHIMALLLLLAAGAANAAEVALVGLIGDRAAVLSIAGGEPKMVKLRQTWNGITLLSLEHDRAIVEVDGRKRVLLPGYIATESPAAHAAVSPVAALAADGAGHFVAEAAVNGRRLRFIVDTGATLVALPASDARRLGIDYRSGARGVAQTANGTVPIYRVSLDRVTLGDIELRSVEAVVVEQGLDFALLGMSFLNHVNMKLAGSTMTLTRR